MKKINSQFYTVAEAAQLWRFSPLTLYKWIREGKMKVVKFGSRSYRIQKKEVSVYFDAQ